jgi:hypothetical protein
MSGWKNEGLFEITQWNLPQRYSYKSISRLPFPIERIESAVTFAPKENGTQIAFDAPVTKSRIRKHTAFIQLGLT